MSLSSVVTVWRRVTPRSARSWSIRARHRAVGDSRRALPGHAFPPGHLLKVPELAVCGAGGGMSNDGYERRQVKELRQCGQKLRGDISPPRRSDVLILPFY